MSTYSWDFQAVESISHDRYSGRVDTAAATSYAIGSTLSFGPDELGGAWTYTITSGPSDVTNSWSPWRWPNDMPGWVRVWSYETGSGEVYRPYGIDLGGSQIDYNGYDGTAGLGSELDRVSRDEQTGPRGTSTTWNDVRIFGQGYYVVTPGRPGLQGLVSADAQGQLDFLRFDFTTLDQSALRALGNWHVAADGSFGGDAHPDLVTQDATGVIDFVYMREGTMVGSLMIGGNYWDVHAAGRFSGMLQKDGVLTQDAVTHQIDLLWFDGLNLQASSLLEGAYDPVVAAADLDGDRISEIVTQNAAGQLDVLKFTGTRLTQSSLLPGNYDPVKAVSNVLHDGSTPYLVTQNANSGAVNELHFAVSFGANGPDHLDGSLALPGQAPLVNAGLVASDAWHLW